MKIALIYGPGNDPYVRGVRDAIAQEAENSTSPKITVHVIMTRTEVVDGVEMPVRPGTPHGSHQEHFCMNIKDAHGAIAVIGKDKDDGKTTDRGNAFAEWAFYIAVRSDHCLVTSIIDAGSCTGAFPDWVPERYGDLGVDYVRLVEGELRDNGFSAAARLLLGKVLHLIGANGSVRTV